MNTLIELIKHGWAKLVGTEERNNMENIIALLEALSSTINDLQVKLADANVAMEEIKQVSFDSGKVAGIEEGKVLGFEDGKKVGYDEGYAKGFEDGKASGGNGDKIYSQAEVDLMIAPLNEKIASLEAEVQAIKDSIEGLKVEAVNAFKLEIKAKYDEAQLAESVLETSFGDLLK